MDPFPPPRAYVDWMVPMRSDGTPMERTVDDDDYKRYIEWLADYLYETDIPVPDCQKDLDGFPCFVPDVFAPDAFEGLERTIEEGRDFATYYGEMTKQWEEYYKELQEQFPDSEESDKASNKEYFFKTCVATEAQFKRVAAEIEDRKRKGVSEWLSHADIPYRAVFSRTLKKMARHEDRVKALRDFYGWLNKELDCVFSK